MKIEYIALPTVYAAARRERAQAVYRLIIAPLIAFFAGLFVSKPPVRRTRMLNRSAFG